MKKVLLIAAVAALVITMLAAPALADGAVSLFVTADKTEVHPGDEVTWTFSVANNTGNGVGNLEFSVGLPAGWSHVSEKHISLGEDGGRVEYNPDYRGTGRGMFVFNCYEGYEDAGPWTALTLTVKVGEDAALGAASLTISDLYTSYLGSDGMPKEQASDKAVSAVSVTHSDEQHVWDEEHSEVTQEATCTAAGERTYTCAVEGCGKTKKEAIEATGHDYQASETDATCTKAGTTTYTCSKCGDSYTETGKPLGHSYGEWVEDKKPTCTEAGTKHRDCQNACCTVADESAREEGWRETESIPTVAHEKGDVAEQIDATCTEEGKTTYKCTMCGQVIDEWTETEPALGHLKPEDESLIETVTEATCTEEGSIRYTCQRCMEEVTEAVPALGHAWDEGKVTKEATASAKGERTYTCTRCGQTKTEAIPAKGAASKPAATGGATSPETGDETPLALCAGALALCLGGLVLALAARKKRGVR